MTQKRFGASKAGKSSPSQEVEIVLRERHPGQQAIHDHPARFKVVMCGRRFGKTAYGARLAEDAAIAGRSVGWFTPEYKYATEVWRELVRDLGPIIAHKNEQEKRLELVTGGVIEIWTLDGDDPARGRKYHQVIVDEAGLVPSLLTIWNAAIRPTLVDYRGLALFLGTPKGRRHGFVTLFNRGLSEDPDWQSFRARTLDNPYIPPEEVEAARRELPPEVFAQEFEGIPTDDGANPFGLDAIRSSAGPLSTATPVVYGVDLARSVDYTVVIGLDAYRRVCFLERWQAPWAVTKTKVQHLVQQTPIVADATGVGDAIVADLQALGVSVTPHVFTQPSKLRLMQRLVAAFQGKELTLPDGHDARWLLAELEAFEFTYTATGVRYEAPPGEHDDGVMALALALFGWDRVQGVIPDAPEGLRSTADDPYVQAELTGARTNAVVPGDFSAQLPAFGW
jgi:hypothetical protein